MSQIKKAFVLEPQINELIAEMLQDFSLQLQSTKYITDSILQLSDFYIAKPEAATPWQHKWCQIAYMSYFFPLNYLRCLAVIQEGKNLGFFDNIKTISDFGSGLGSASTALQMALPQRAFDIHSFEQSNQAQDLHQKIVKKLSLKNSHYWENTPDTPCDLAVFSYSLTEIDFCFPDWALQSEKLMIVEPATQTDGRKLLELRQKLINQGYHIWAPCTHQLACPLYTHSQKDWCHDRIQFEQPSWFSEIEKRLPIKNQNLTFSYLLASKKEAPSLVHKARIVGDQLKEKGKTRQMVCRGENREFLTWLHRHGEPPEYSRGVLIHFNESEYQSLGNELRKI